MKVESAKVIRQSDGSTMLSMVIDGKPADVYEPKLPLLEAGYVVLLNGDWSEELEINLPANWHPDYPKSNTLYGATDDPVIVELARRFVSGQYPQGELAIPQ